MKTNDFYFDLPESLIAQYPLPNRRDSRLLVYDKKLQRTSHHQFKDLSAFLQEGDLLVMNNSAVLKARLYGQKASGGKVEVLLERQLDEFHFDAHIRASKAPKAGTEINLREGKTLEVLGKSGGLYHCRSTIPVDALLEAVGHIPLPPYIKRNDDALDSERYQTVYAAPKGSVAAPTAGLHFDSDMLATLHKQGIQTAFVTLHVGAGTFQPVRCEKLSEHRMHEERYYIAESLAEQIRETKQRGNRVIAVGTTTLRSLESAYQQGALGTGWQKTSIFIYPGFQFQVVDGLITNFHLPESTLLMLVSAFIGYENTMALYHEAISKGYRFFSYGDTSLLF